MRYNEHSTAKDLEMLYPGTDTLELYDDCETEDHEDAPSSIFQFETSSNKNIWERGIPCLRISCTYDFMCALVTKLHNGRFPEGWNYRRHDFFNTVYRDKNIHIRTMGYFHNFDLLRLRDVVIPSLTATDYILLTDWGQQSEDTRFLLAKAKHPDNFYWLCNGEKECETVRNNGFQAEVVSHNCFIHSGAFTVRNMPKTFDAVLCGSFRPQKRQELSTQISNIIYLSDGFVDDYTQSLRIPKHKVKTLSSPIHISTVMNTARCGLCLSDSEGGCYSSTEYLLSGIPVVSTRPSCGTTGGREVYYDDYNSVVCDPTPEAVAKAVKDLKTRNPNPHLIRANALRISQQMLSTLANKIIQPIFDKHQIGLQANKYISACLSLYKNRPATKGRTCFQPEEGHGLTKKECDTAIRLTRES